MAFNLYVDSKFPGFIKHNRFSCAHPCFSVPRSFPHKGDLSFWCKCLRRVKSEYLAFVVQAFVYAWLFTSFKKSIDINFQRNFVRTTILHIGGCASAPETPNPDIHRLPHRQERLTPCSGLHVALVSIP